MHQITVTMSVLQEALFCLTVQLKNEESQDEGRDDGAKVELVKILDENKDEDRSPAPVVYGIGNRKLFRSPKFYSQNSLGQLQARRAWQCERGPGKGEKEDREDLVLSFAPLLSSCWAHHLAEGWACVVMMTCEGPLCARWVPKPASTDMATASAAARELTPFGPDDPEGLSATELCWITGAGEPVASHTSFMDSSPGGHKYGSVTHYSHVSWIKY